MPSVTARPAARRSRLAWLASAVTLSATSVAALVLAGMLTQPGGSLPAPDVTAVAQSTDGDTVLDELAEDEAVIVLSPPDSTTVSLERDPFEPVVEEATAPSDPFTPRDPDDPGDPDDPRDPGDPRDASEPPGPADPLAPRDPSDPPTDAACTGEVEMVCDGRVLTLDEVRADDDGSRAVITVDGATYVVGLGDVFASDFALHGIDGTCATVFFEGHTYRLCTSGTVLK